MLVTFKETRDEGFINNDLRQVATCSVSDMTINNKLHSKELLSILHKGIWRAEIIAA